MSSLVKSPTMSPAKVAANQANALQSTGPVTPEGLDRVRQGRLQHGLRASEPRDVLAFLGEDADEFDRYKQALFQNRPTPLRKLWCAGLRATPGGWTAPRASRRIPSP